jgi:hypothetical protein
MLRPWHEFLLWNREASIKGTFAKFISSLNIIF